MVEELDAVELEGGADGIEIAAAGAGHRIEFFSPRDGGFRYAAELRQILYRPAQEGTCRADLSARDCRFRRLHVSARAILVRRHIYLSSSAASQDVEVPAQGLRPRIEQLAAAPAGRTCMEEGRLRMSECRAM